MVLPLQGVKVIEMGQALAGPLSGMILADLGAEVVKIERPGGGDDARAWGPFVDDNSVFFEVFNRNKKSVQLDLKTEADREYLLRLAEGADILIQNLRPGIVGEIGLGPDTLMKRNPRLIYCSIWAFGSAGPLRHKPGYDPLLQAYGGVMTLTGRPEDPPTFQAPAINDKATGMWCVIAALAALRQRDETGKGCVIDTSLFDTAVSWVEGQVNGYLAGGIMPERHGTASAVVVPYQAFSTSDRPIVIAAGNDRLYYKLCDILGRKDLAEDPRFVKARDRVTNRDALIPEIQQVLVTRGADEWMKELDRAGVPATEINDIPALARSEQLQAVNLLQDLPENLFRAVSLPMMFDGARLPFRTRAPKPGAHTDEVLSALQPRAGAKTAAD